MQCCVYFPQLKKYIYIYIYIQIHVLDSRKFNIAAINKSVLLLIVIFKEIYSFIYENHAFKIIIILMVNKLAPGIQETKALCGHLERTRII